MNNNDILRQVRYMFDLGDADMMKLFKLGNLPATRATVSDWLKKEDDEAFLFLEDEELATFLNGLIVKNRGKREGPPPVPEKRLSNNNILRKLKIALNLKSDDMLAIFKLANKRLGEHELSAFLRNPKQHQYRPLNDQYLRNFMHGLQVKYRPKRASAND